MPDLAAAVDTSDRRVQFKLMGSREDLSERLSDQALRATYSPDEQKVAAALPSCNRFTARQAATVIQRAYRRYKLLERFHVAKRRCAEQDAHGVADRYRASRRSMIHTPNALHNGMAPLLEEDEEAPEAGIRTRHVITVVTSCSAQTVTARRCASGLANHRHAQVHLQASKHHAAAVQNGALHACAADMETLRSCRLTASDSRARRSVTCPES